MNHLRAFVSKSFSHIPKDDKKKLDPKATKCIFLGYYTEFKAYKVFNPLNHKGFASWDVLFHKQTKEGNKEKNLEEWHMSLLMEESSEDMQ